MNELCVGQIVRSTAGRDRNSYFMIVGFEESDRDFVLLADGRLRKVGHPKKKNVKHIAKTNCIDEALSEKLLKHEKILNVAISKSISSFLGV